MKRLKVMTIVGTRPEIIRLARVMAKLDEHCDHVLVHTGQNYDYELNQIFFDDMKIRKPDHFLAAAGATAAETIGNIIIAADRLLAEIRPDAVLVLGDTNSCLAMLPAKRGCVAHFASFTPAPVSVTNPKFGPATRMPGGRRRNGTPGTGR